MGNFVAFMKFSKTNFQNILYFDSEVFRPFGRPVYRFGRPISGAQKALFHFRIGLEDKNADRREETMWEKEVERKEKIVYESVFIHLDLQ